MDREHILSIMYEMAQVIGGEVSVQPLLTKTLQHLLYNTSFPSGFVCLGAPFSAADPEGKIEVVLDTVVGDYELVGLEGSKVRLPARLLLGAAECCEDADLLAALPCNNAYKGYLRLPVEGQGVIVLLAPKLPETGLPLAQLFRPVMASLARAIMLCRNNDAYTDSLIAARDASQQALATSEEKFKAISAAVLDALIMLDDRGAVEYWNPAAERILGYRGEEVLGKMLHDLLAPPQYREQAARGLSAFRASGQGAMIGKTTEIEAQHKDGHIIPVELSISAFKFDGFWHAVGILRDIGEYKKAEATRTLLAAIVESSNDAIIGKDLQGIITSWNKGAEKIYGYSAAEIIGQSITVLAPPERYAEIADFLKKLRRGETIVDYESERIRKDGEWIYVALTLSPIHDESGNISGISTIARDITGRKQAEMALSRLNTELEHRVAERTAQLETVVYDLENFNYSVSHDLRIPLRAVDGFSRILMEEYSSRLDEEGVRLLNVVRDNTQKIAQYIDDMLAFSSTGRMLMSFAEIDMVAVVREVMEELKPVIAGRDLKLEINPLPSVVADRAMMRRVMLNLLSNALKFTRVQTSARIEVGAKADEMETVFFVRDNGVGFDMQYVDKLFGVFQRLHGVDEFEGTGIGLAIVKRIVGRHGGRVWAEGKVNEGATIYFSIPRAALNPGKTS